MMKNKLLSIPVLLLAFLPAGNNQYKSIDTANTGTLTITFINTVKGVPLELNTGSYTNPFNESYTVSKFKYYISNILLHSLQGNFSEAESYHLVDEGKPGSLSFSLSVAEKKYQSISFMLGVDSLRNVSGAQTGALDPLNDMFWTWNSGYVMAKMEGNSPESKMVNHKVEFHIGGFSGPWNVLKNITLQFPENALLNIRNNIPVELVIEADLDTWWHGSNDMRITEHPVCTTPGALAKQFAGNYSRMFTLKQVKYN